MCLWQTKSSGRSGEQQNSAAAGSENKPIPILISGSLLLRQSNPVRGIHKNLRVTRGAATESTGPGIKNAVLLCYKLAVFLLLAQIAIVPDVEFPAHRRVFGRQSVEHRDVVILGKSVAVWIVRIAALECSGVSSGLKHNDAVPSFRQSCRNCPAARSRTDFQILAIMPF